MMNSPCSSLGFKGNNFIVWDETARREVATIECGGGHRPFSCVPDLATPDRFRFVYTKAALHACIFPEVCLFENSESRRSRREIKAAAACGKYLATAAEDTTIRIWQYDDSDDELSRRFQCLAILEKHTAGVQCLRWLAVGETYLLLSSGGNEEFFIWHVSQFDSAYRGLAVVCVAQYPDPTADRDLRITDFDVAEESVPRVDGEDTRRCMQISMVLSNSTLRTYQYDREIGGVGAFSLLAEAKYTGACLMHVRQLRAREGAPPSFLTASTDGYITVWELSHRDGRGSEGDQDTPYRPYLPTKLHQNSIKSLDLRPYQELEGIRGWLVATGGDDNALGILDLEWDSLGNGYRIASKTRVKDAHAAAVTGVCLTTEPGGPIQVASVSNHQCIKLWEVRTRRQDAAKIVLLDEGYSSVADSGGLEILLRRTAYCLWSWDGGLGPQQRNGGIALT